MAFDGILMHRLTSELQSKLIGGRIDKIYQPEKDELAISIRSLGAQYQVFVSIDSALPYITITQHKKDNPHTPPMFCMLMRKLVVGARVLSIEQSPYERVLMFTLECKTELGDQTIRKLSVEIMGKHSNVILTKEDNTIIDALKRVSYDMSRVRPVIPGMQLAPIASSKTLFTKGMHAIQAEAHEQTPISKALVQSFSGFSPELAQYILYKAHIDKAVPLGQLSAFHLKCLDDALLHLEDQLKRAQNDAFIFKTDEGKATLTFLSDFLPFAPCEAYPSLTEAIDAFYSSHNKVLKMHQKTLALKKQLQVRVDRLIAKLAKLSTELSDAEQSDLYRIKGELLLASLHTLKKGDSRASVLNYYEHPPIEMDIDLDILLEPSENAAAYFKKYNKAKHAKITLEHQIRETQLEISYLEQVLVHLENSDDDKTVTEIRLELTQGGYLKKKPSKKQPHQAKSTFLTYKSTEGFLILVGKNNLQNDLLTLKTASNKDYWLHTKDIPGSHVIVRLEGQTPNDTTLEEAAMIAAYHSKARASSNVPVDFTLVKHVNKPSGAKPGMVIYTHQKTLFVTPNEAAIAALEYHG